MLKKYFLTNLQGFDLHHAGGYTVSLACSQFLVVDIYPQKSTGNTQEAVAPSQHD